MADALAGIPADPAVSEEVETQAPNAQSTRKLFGGVAPVDPNEMGPDPEERRLSAELDFGKPDRHQRQRERGGAGRVFLVIIAAIVVLCVAAVIFKDNIVSALPQAEPLYAAVGLK